jgi:hypothetical protein
MHIYAGFLKYIRIRRVLIGKVKRIVLTNDQANAQKGEYDACQSVFRLDEIVDGYHILSNAVVTEFERNKRLKLKAPFSTLPIIELGTCLDFVRLPSDKTRSLSLGVIRTKRMAWRVRSTIRKLTRK